jgi:hypothetical protein
MLDWYLEAGWPEEDDFFSICKYGIYLEEQ